MLKRRDFIKFGFPVAAGLMFGPEKGWTSEAAGPSNDYVFKTPFYRVALSATGPEITAMSFDSLGHGGKPVNPIIPVPAAADRQTWHVVKTLHSVTYRLVRHGQITNAGWRFDFQPRGMRIRCTVEPGIQPDPLTLKFDQYINHVTLLGRMKKSPQEMLCPCLLHMPDMGTASLTCSMPKAGLGYDALRWVDDQQYVKIIFPVASAHRNTIDYTLEVTSIYPHLPGIEKDPRFDGFRRNFLNIFQINPRLRALANNASSDTCAFTVYEYAMVAAQCPPLARGLTALDILRDTLDRYCDGMVAYGMVGYGANYDGAKTGIWRSPFDALDSLPSLIIAACTYISSSGDWRWARRRFAVLDGWGRKMMQSDTNHNGLIKYPMSGNHGCYSTGHPYRPSNWWDTIGFGHEDAYANALAYRACAMLAHVSDHIGRTSRADFFHTSARKLRSVYYHTFINPQTGLLAGWKSADGELHDYQFLFVNSVAVCFGLLDDSEARAVMKQLLKKIKVAGYSNFRLGLPGNLIPVPVEDYFRSPRRFGGGGAKGFQIYENGGATACFSYFTVEALFRTGLTVEARNILYPMLESFKDGSFSGKGADGMTRDWKTWSGKCYGYEGFLVDGYLALLAVLTDRHAAGAKT